MRKQFLSNFLLTLVLELLLLVLIILLVPACKKNTTKVPGITENKSRRISAIYINNVLNEKYYYDSEKRISKMEEYNTDGTLYITRHYEFDAAGVLSAIKGILPDGSLKTKSTFLKNTEGQIVQNDFINVGVVAYTYKYEYNAFSPKQLLKSTQYDDPGMELYKTEYSYDAANLISEKNSYLMSAAGLFSLGWKYTYTIIPDPGKVDRYKELVSAFAHPQPDEWIIYQVVDIIKSYKYDAAIVEQERHDVISGREYDSKGYVTSIILNLQYITPVGAGVIKNIRYEYTEL